MAHGETTKKEPTRAEREERTFLEVLLVGVLGAGTKMAWDELSKRAAKQLADKAKGKFSDKSGMRQSLARTIASMDLAETEDLRRRLAEAQEKHREDQMKDLIGTLLYPGKTQEEVDSNKKFATFLNKLNDTKFREFLLVLTHDDWAQTLLRFMEEGGEVAKEDAEKIRGFLGREETKILRPAIECIRSATASMKKFQEKIEARRSRREENR
jgi:hypothetical protein